MDHKQSEPQFDFGENWLSFSKSALDEGKVSEAERCFCELFAGIELEGRSFLDIGFGQGLGLLNAAKRGASVLGCDINPKCATALERNRRFFPGVSDPIPTVIGSILDEEILKHIRNLSSNGTFDIVHSWGVLHHTGNMPGAIANASTLVKADGLLIIAIYNKHWSSPFWTYIKRAYVGSPKWIRAILITLLIPPIAIAKFGVTGRNPFRQERGMAFFYDVIDWVGGYPYEYASTQEIEDLIVGLGFTLTSKRAARVPTGCNEFIFRKI